MELACFLASFRPQQASHLPRHSFFCTHNFSVHAGPKSFSLVRCLAHSPAQNLLTQKKHAACLSFLPDFAKVRLHGIPRSQGGLLATEFQTRGRQE